MPLPPGGVSPMAMASGGSSLWCCSGGTTAPHSREAVIQEPEEEPGRTPENQIPDICGRCVQPQRAIIQELPVHATAGPNDLKPLRSGGRHAGHGMERRQETSQSSSGTVRKSLSSYRDMVAQGSLPAPRASSLNGPPEASHSLDESRFSPPHAFHGAMGAARPDRLSRSTTSSRATEHHGLQATPSPRDLQGSLQALQASWTAPDEPQLAPHWAHDVEGVRGGADPSEVTTSYASSSPGSARNPLMQLLASLHLRRKLEEAWTSVIDSACEVLDFICQYVYSLTALGVFLLLLTITVVIVGQMVQEMDFQVPPDVPWSLWRGGHVGVSGGNSSLAIVDKLVSLRSQEISAYANFEVVLVYEMLGGTPVVESTWRSAFLEAAIIERRLQSLAGWRDFCGGRTSPDSQRLCNPGVSVAAHALPSLEYADLADRVPISFRPDGKGADVQSTAVAIHLGRRYSQTDAIWPVGFSESTAMDDEVTSFRSMFLFRVYTCSAADPISLQRRKLLDVKEDWRKFVHDELIQELEKIAGHEGSDESKKAADRLPFRLRYTGHFVEDPQYRLAATRDALLMVPFVLVLAVVCMSVYLNSITLGTFGGLILVLASLLAHNIIKYLSKETELALSSLMSPFLIFGIGSDFIFVVSEAWCEGQRMLASEPERMMIAYIAAGRFPLAFCASMILCLTIMVWTGFGQAEQLGYHILVGGVCIWIGLVAFYIPALAWHDRMPWRFCQSLRDTMRGVADKARRSSRSSVGSEQRGNSQRPSILGVGLGDFVRSNVDASQMPDVGSWIVGRLYHNRIMCQIGAAALVVIMAAAFVAGIIVVDAEDASKGLLPEDHNLLSIDEALAKFSSPDLGESPLPPIAEPVCSETDFGDDVTTRCGLLWCEASLSTSSTQAAQAGCQCARIQAGCPDGPTMITQRFMQAVPTYGGQKEPLEAAALISLAQGRIREAGFEPGNATVRDAPHLIVQSWEVGYGKLAKVRDVEITTDASTAEPCVWKDLCWCQIETCAGVEDRIVAAVSAADLESARAASVTELGQTTARPQVIASASEAWRAKWPYTVEVVHGFNSVTSGKLSVLGIPTFGRFEPTGLNEQRSLLRMCTDVTPELRIARRQCWLEDFRLWLYARGPQFRYPMWSDQFHPNLIDFLNNGTGNAEGFVWLDNGELRAHYLRFELDVPPNISLEEIQALKHKWDTYVDQWRASAPPGVSSVWHTSVLWEASQATVGTSSAGSEDSDKRWVAPLVLGSIIVAIATSLIMVRMTLGAATFAASLGISCIFAGYLRLVVDRPLGLLEVTCLMIGFCYAACYTMHVSIAPLQGHSGCDIYMSSWCPIGGSLPASAVVAVVTSLPFLACKMPAYTRACASTLVAVLIAVVIAGMPLMLVRLGSLHQALTEASRRQWRMSIDSKDVESEASSPAVLGRYENFRRTLVQRRETIIAQRASIQ